MNKDIQLGDYVEVVSRYSNMFGKRGKVVKIIKNQAEENLSSRTMVGIDFDEPSEFTHNLSGYLSTDTGYYIRTSSLKVIKRAKKKSNINNYI